VKGRQIDIYMWNCNEALAFGRRTMGLHVMRLGWNPRTSTPDRVRSEFRKREAEMTTPGQAPVTAPPPTTPAPPARPAPAETPSSGAATTQPTPDA
jgi:hypothetical protein